MDNLVSKIKQRASGLSGDECFEGCVWAEQIPRLFRGELNPEMRQRIQKHLETCEECNELLLALAASGAAAPRFKWVKQGLYTVFEGVISMFEGGGSPAYAMRSKGAEYDMHERQIELPNGDSLCFRIVKQGDAKLVTVFSVGGRDYRYDLHDSADQLVKSTDKAKQFKFDMPKEKFKLVVDVQFILEFEGDAL